MGVRVAQVACLLVTASAALAPAAQAQVTEYPVPTPNAGVDQITLGPDGALWFTERGANRIGRITTSGVVTEFPVPDTVILNGITAGPDGALWFADDIDKIGRMTTAGSVTEYSLPTQSSDPFRITSGPDGALWFTERNGRRIGRITTSGQITEFPLPDVTPIPGEIVTGPDGALWVTQESERSLVRITTTGQVTEFPAPSGPGGPPTSFGGIVSGPGGALWVTESDSQKLARVTTGGAFTEFPVAARVDPVAEPGFTLPKAIAAGPDGALWITLGNSKIGRMTTSGAVALLRLRSADPLSSTGLGSITAGPDGALWFTDPEVNAIGRVPAGPLPPVDSVTGAFTTAPQCGLRCSPPAYELDVGSEPQGAAPKGEIDYRQGTLFLDFHFAKGTFSCLRTSGSRATMGVDFAGSTTGSTTTAPRSALIFIEDNGPTGDRFAVVDLPAGTAPSTCPAVPPAGVTLAPVVNGDLLVTDASPETATCAGRPTTREGTAGDDTIAGTPGDDVISGGGGNDVVDALGGNDIVCGGAGDDRVRGGPGNDALLGEDGEDRLRGGSGNDLLVGGAGVDRLRGAPGDDTLVGGPAGDLLLGGLGRDNCPVEGADVRIGCEQ